MNEEISEWWDNNNMLKNRDGYVNDGNLNPVNWNNMC